MLVWNGMLIFCFCTTNAFYRYPAWNRRLHRQIYTHYTCSCFSSMHIYIQKLMEEQKQQEFWGNTINILCMCRCMCIWPTMLRLKSFITCRPENKSNSAFNSDSGEKLYETRKIKFHLKQTNKQSNKKENFENNENIFSIPLSVGTSQYSYSCIVLRTCSFAPQ